MSDLYDELTHWSHGVVTSAEQDRPELKNSLVLADNAQFASVASGNAALRKRYGMTLVNSTPLNNSSGTGPAIVAGFPYRYTSGGSRTRYTVVITATGNVHMLVDDGATTSLTATASFTGVLNTSLVGGDAVEMNNRLFIFDRKGGATSLLGTVNAGWGVTPVTGLALTPTGSGSMTGDYEVVVTKWDSRIGEESEISASVASGTMSAQDLQITVNAVAVGNTHLFYRVYLRKPVLGSGFYRVLSGTGYDGTQMGFPLYSASPTVSTTIDISDATFENYVLVAPAVNSKGLPPTNAKYCAVFARRLFVASDTHVYWSELDHPDSFNPTSVEPINSPRGGNIVGLIPHASGMGLQILTETGRHAIIGGADPNGWTIDVEESAFGAVSRGALTGYRKSVVAWAGEGYGPVLISPEGQINYIGSDRIRDQVSEDTIESAYYSHFLSAAHDGRVLFGVVDQGQTRVQRFLVFNMEMGAWESTNWDPMDAASLFVSQASDGSAYLYLGNYNGQLFRLLKGGNDGVRSGTTSGTFVAGSATIGTITDLTAAFDTTGAGLRERRVRLLDANGELVQGGRIRISSNTATALTLSANFSVTSGATYTYLIGGPDFRMETYWGHLGVPFLTKRFDALYTEVRADDGVARVYTDIGFSWDPTRKVTASQDEQSSELWDAAYWDVAFWDGITTLTKRTAILKTGINYRIKLYNPYPDQGFTVTKLAVLARQLSDRYAGTSVLR